MIGYQAPKLKKNEKSWTEWWKPNRNQVPPLEFLECTRIDSNLFKLEKVSLFAQSHLAKFFHVERRHKAIEEEHYGNLFWRELILANFASLDKIRQN